MNSDQKTLQPRANIHGVGFLSERTTRRFAILMRELTRKNGDFSGAAIIRVSFWVQPG
jgi:hypothetical protein